jgi:hypothetical protein
MRFWKRDTDIGGVETSLRSQRPRLDRSLESDLMSRLSSRPASRSGYRLALATGMTVAVFAALASFGGVSYAVSAAQQAVSGTSGTNTSSTTNSSTGQYGEGTCVEYVNPHGATIPPAGQTSPGTNPNSGQNPDGFYLIGSSGGGDVYVIDTGTGTVFGPYPSGTVIKYTEANGKTPTEIRIGSDNGQAGAVTVHISGQGDPAVQSVSGGPLTVCLVPPPPK